MNTNKKNSNIVKLMVFALLITLFPQFGYAEDPTVEVFYPLGKTNEQIANTNAKIEIIAGGVRKLEDGRYQIGLLLKHPDLINKGYVTLDPTQSSYAVTLIDTNDNANDFKIDKDQITYPNECENGILSTKTCLVHIFVGPINDDVKYKSYRVTLRHPDRKLGDIELEFIGDIPEIETWYSLDTKCTEHKYILHIKNSSEKKITINTDDISLVKKCIELESFYQKEYHLNAQETCEIEFKIRKELPADETCNEYVNIPIIYKTNDTNEDNKPKTVFIPIKITTDHGNVWSSPPVIGTTSLLYMAAATIITIKCNSKWATRATVYVPATLLLSIWGKKTYDMYTQPSYCFY